VSATERLVFWLGTDMPSWLATCPRSVMVSRRRLAKRRTFPVARMPWFLDSGGFTELSINGAWSLTASDYADEVRRYADEIGNLTWISPQDWMCEPWVIAKTGLTVGEHQRRTVDNFLELRALLPDHPVIPVLQGWEIGDYASHVDMYADAGVTLRDEPLVGLGSVCRRQATNEIGDIVTMLHGHGLRLHGFGCKVKALALYGHLLASADSMAWSFGGRYVKPCPVRAAASCAHCLHFALEWLDRLPEPDPSHTWHGQQMSLFALRGRK